VTVWTDHVEDPATLATRLHDAEALVLFRERTAIGAPLLDRLPNLRLISQRSAYPHIDLAACTRNGVLLCSNMGADGPSIATAELTFGLIIACARDLLNQNASLRAGHWQRAPGQTLAGRVLGLYGHGRIAGQVAHYARAFGMGCNTGARTRAGPAPEPRARRSLPAAKRSSPPPISSRSTSG
jgi:Lactate dehydrogenase and related dehydrogenases